jgi:hypothetical protein
MSPQARRVLSALTLEPNRPTQEEGQRYAENRYYVNLTEDKNLV